MHYKMLHNGSITHDDSNGDCSIRIFYMCVYKNVFKNKSGVHIIRVFYMCAYEDVDKHVYKQE